MDIHEEHLAGLEESNSKMAELCHVAIQESMPNVGLPMFALFLLIPPRVPRINDDTRANKTTPERLSHSGSIHRGVSSFCRTKNPGDGKNLQR